jgi:serine/threonine protein kinase
LVKYLDYFEDKNKTYAYLLMEYCERGDLEEFKKKRKFYKKPLKEVEIISLLYQCVSGFIIYIFI